MRLGEGFKLIQRHPIMEAFAVSMAHGETWMEGVGSEGVTGQGGG